MIIALCAFIGKSVTSFTGWNVWWSYTLYVYIYIIICSFPPTQNPHMYTHTHRHILTRTYIYMHTHTYNNRWVPVTSRTRVFFSTPSACPTRTPDCNPSSRAVATTPSAYRSSQTNGGRLWHHIHGKPLLRTNPKSPASRAANWIWHRRR